MAAPIDRRGQRFGKLEVLELAPPSAAQTRKGRAWVCRCDCGQTTTAQGGNLQSGNTISCGCARHAPNWTKRKGLGRDKTKGSLYLSWIAMLARIDNPNHRGYHLYGGRGITICNRWRRSFEAFAADMGPRPAGRTLDRIDTNGNYELGNCRWATPTEQARNRRYNHFHTPQGEPPSRTYNAWSRMIGRCMTPTHQQYHLYGGRGINVCSRWWSFPAFLDDMGECPAGASLDRTSLQKNFEPENCVWSTASMQTAANMATHGHAASGLPSATYRAWERARAKCRDENHPQFAAFGGRGIKVCDSWRDSFPAFLNDIGEKPDGLVLVRVDIDGDFSPENCKWGTFRESLVGRSNRPKPNV